MALGTKVLVLTAFAVILFSASLSIGVQTSYAQFEPSPSQQQEQQQEGEEPEVASDGGLTATLNGESFRRGDTIVVSGTVEEREDGSTVYARIFDPDSIELDIEGIRVNTDGTFRHDFVAGEDSVYSVG